MIIGVTHNSDGHVVQRLSVSTKIAIGLPPNGDRNYPTKLDHFVFLRKKRTAKGVEWEPDPELTGHYGNDCRAIRIVLIDDDIENSFPTSYAWWTAVDRKCWGDGASATRRTPEKPGGQPWTPCGSGCPELASALCKPSGDMRFVLQDFPKLGSACRIHTSSYRSIRQIHSSLQEIHSFTGGRLAGLAAKLVVRPEEAAYFDPKEKRKKSTTIWALSLEVDGEDMRELVGNLTENARVFAETRKLLGSGRVIEVVEEEVEQAPELAGEFYDTPRVAAPEKRRETERSEPDRGEQTSSAPASSPPSGQVTSPEGKPVNGSTGGSVEHPREALASQNNREPAEAPPWEAAPGAAGTNRQATIPSERKQCDAQAPAVGAPKSNGAAESTGASPKTAAVCGVVGPLEPDESGQTLRRNSRGVEYVIFKVSQNGSGTLVYCNRPELLPEIARRQGREGAAQVTMSGTNGHQYYILDHFSEA
jgi:hypothetical protein